MKIIFKILWKKFCSKTPALVIAGQSITVAIGGYGATIAATHWTGGLNFLNNFGPEMISFGTIGTIALQFIEKVEDTIAGLPKATEDINK